MSIRTVTLAAVIVIGFVSRAALAQGIAPGSDPAVEKPPHLEPKLPRFEIGARLQASIIETQLGLDLGYRPSEHIGLGLIFGHGSFRQFNSHCADQCRDAEWFWFSPYVEGRLNPSGTLSPYGRIAVGLASGAFTDWRDDPSDTVPSGHAEVGLDFHFAPKGPSLRLFLGGEVSSLNRTTNGSVFGIPGLGAQLGASF